MHPLQYYLATMGDELREFHGNASTLISGAAADSRKIKPGFIFVAIPGQQTDGALFVKQAIAAGANTVVATRELELAPNVNLVIVKNAYTAASRIAEASAGYPARSMRLLGVTGTNGKTTCAYLLRDIFRTDGCRTGMIGTVQYEIGGQLMAAERTTPTPFMLQRILSQMREAQTEIAIIEASSQALDQRRLGTARFAGALFTNLTGDHCDYHRTMANYFSAKQVLFTEYLRSNAPSVINIDDPYGRQLADKLAAKGNGKVVTFGTAGDADWQIISWNAGLEGVQIEIKGPDNKAAVFKSPVIGDFNIYNITGSVVLAKLLGANESAINSAVSHFRGAPGRMEASMVRDGVMAFVDYAHTDDALANVLSSLRKLECRRIFVVFGCGGDRDRSKRPRMGKAAAVSADRLYITSDNPRSEDPKAIIDEISAGIPDGVDTVVLPDRREAIRQALSDARAGDVILIAGKGHENYQEINGVKYPFDDREEVRRYNPEVLCGCQ